MRSSQRACSYPALPAHIPARIASVILAPSRSPARLPLAQIKPPPVRSALRRSPPPAPAAHRRRDRDPLPAAAASSHRCCADRCRCRCRPGRSVAACPARRAWIRRPLRFLIVQSDQRQLSHRSEPLSEPFAVAVRRSSFANRAHGVFHSFHKSPFPLRARSTTALVVLVLRHLFSIEPESDSG